MDEEKLLKALAESEITEEEEIIPLKLPAINERIVFLVQNSGKNICMDFFSQNKEYEVSKMFYNYGQKAIENSTLEKAIVLSSLSDLVKIKKEYLSSNFENLISDAALEMYVDFYPRISDFLQQKAKETKTGKKTLEKAIPLSSYFKGPRADLSEIVESIAKLCEGIEPALEYAAELNDLKRLVSSNLFLKFYQDTNLKEKVREDINSGKVSPKNSFVYTVINYHKSLLNILGD
jgi:hypothetical protein